MAHKNKTHKGVQKRVKISAGRKVKIRRPGSGHLLSHKTGKRLRRLRRPLTVASCEARRVLYMVGLR